MIKQIHKLFTALSITLLLAFSVSGQESYDEYYPNVSNLTHNSVQLNVSASVGGMIRRKPTHYTLYILFEASEDAPLVEDVIDWTFDGNGGQIPEDYYGDIGLEAPFEEFSVLFDDLEPNTAYIAYLVTVEDDYETVVIETTDPTAVSFTTTAEPVPFELLWEELLPAPGAINVSVNPTFTLKFNEDIKWGTSGVFKVITINENEEHIPVTTISPIQAGTSISGDELTINLSNTTLGYNTEYYIEITEDFVRSQEGGAPFPGIGEDYNWTFTTETATPKWEAGYPFIDGQTEEKFDVNIWADMPGTYYGVLTPSDFTPTIEQIIDGIEDDKFIKIAFYDEIESIDEETIESICFNGKAPTGKDYKVHLVYFNAAKNKHTGIVSFTIDRTPPALYESYPEDKCRIFSVDSLLTLSFSETITGVGENLSEDYFSLKKIGSPDIDINFVFTDLGYGEFTLKPDAELTEDASYKLVINPVSDLYGNKSKKITIEFETDGLFTWSGEGDITDWSDEDNWLGKKHKESKSVLIPAGLDFYPIITDNGNDNDVNTHNLRIEAGASLVNTGANLNITGLFTLESSHSANASYVHNAGTLDVTPANVRFKQAISSSAINYNAASSVSGATKEKAGISNFAYYYENSTNNYVTIEPQDTIVPGKGFIFRSEEGEIVFSGTPNLGEVVVNLSRSQKGRGWNLVGNPYPSAVKFEKLDIENIDESFWIWLNDEGIYGVYNEAVGDGIKITSDIIPSHQAFWVRIPIGEDVSSGSGSITFKPDAMVANTTSYLKAASGPKYPTVKFAAGFKGYYDEAAIAFVPDATTGSEDIYDSQKFFSNNANYCEIYTLANGASLAINGYPAVEDEVVIPVGFSLKEGGEIEISVTKNALGENSTILLRDKQSGVVTDLSSGDSYSFSVSGAGSYNDRLELLLTAGLPTGMVEQDSNKIEGEIQVYSLDSKINAYICGLENPGYYLYNLQGILLQQGDLHNCVNNKIEVQNKGVYIFVVEAGNKFAEYKLVF